MNILSIDTSCDETAAAVTEETTVLSNIVWSQASLHAKWGGVMPSLAKREHEARIDWVVDRSIKVSGIKYQELDAIAVTQGPGLAIALEVGIKKAKELAKKYNLPLVPVNHLEGHLLSPLAQPKNPKYSFPTTHNPQPHFPALALVASGGNTQLILVEKIGQYKILAQTVDDALGEALDKAARMLGLGYPGGAILEKIALNGNPKSYPLPVPLIGQEKRMEFSYSGLKTAFYRLVESEKPLTKEKIENLAASFQDRAFQHITRVLLYTIKNSKLKIKNFFLGGGVSANIELRKRLRKICQDNNIPILPPYTKKLCGDNAAMIGVAAYFRHQQGKFLQGEEIDKIDREPRMNI